MAGPRTENSQVSLASRLYAFTATLLLWTYFIFAFVAFYWIFYAAAWLFSNNRELAFQRLNSRFYRGFFQLLRTVIPGHKWLIDENIRHIRSSVIVCNHVSYLDPLILISLFDHHKTIVKSRFFRMPVFGWIITVSGYLPSTTEGNFSRMMIDHIENMSDFLAKGGNLFIFPEGTRSRNGRLGSLNRGAFKIARLHRTPIRVVQICNTENLYPPGRFLFDTGQHNTITVRLIGQIDPDYEHDPPAASELENRVRRIFHTESCSSVNNSDSNQQK